MKFMHKAQSRRLGTQAAAHWLTEDMLEMVEYRLYDEDFVDRSPSESDDASSGEEEDLKWLHDQPIFLGQPSDSSSDDY